MQTSRWNRRELLLGAGAVATVAAIGPSLASAASREPLDDFDAAVPTAWFDLALTLVRTTPGFTPPVAARVFGYAGVTVYETIVAGAAGHRSIVGTLPGLAELPRARGRCTGRPPPTVHWRRSSEPFSDRPPTRRRSSPWSRRSPSGAPARRARNTATLDGARRAVAGAVFEWSRGDGGDEGQTRNFPASYRAPVGPGLWVPTPPGFQRALQPNWGDNRCFAIGNGTSCPPGDPTPYADDPASPFHREAVEVYDTVNHLSAEQEAIARFWSDDPGETVTPPGHSISVATQVLRGEDSSLLTAAETYARVGIAVCDAFIACWNAKYRYNLLRPVTYVRRQIDPEWLPLLTTPPFPEYPSGHSVQSGAAFAVLADLFGDAYAFTDRTHDDRGLPARQFRSFAAAAEEAAISRLYGGIHYRPAIDLGLAQGRCIGQAVNELPFRER
jgi:PAP2 superfamily